MSLIRSPWDSALSTSSWDRDPLSRLQSSMNRMLSEFAGDLRNPDLGSLSSTVTPRMDIWDRGNELELRAEMPGCPKESINAFVDKNNNLVLKADVKKEEQHQEGRSLIRERLVQRYHRAVPLPDNVDTDQIQCSFNHGILEMHLPKKESAENQGKRITIQ